MNHPSGTLAKTFDYGALGDDAEWLRRKTDRLRAGMTLVAAAVVKIGLELLAVKDRLEIGTFRAWCQAELPWSRSKIKALMRVARVFGDAKQIDQFAPSALYVLCWPSAPLAARQAAFEIVEQGKIVTHGKAVELIGLHTPKPPDDDAPEVRTVASAGTAAPREHSLDERNWADFLDVLGEYRMIHITRNDDDENGMVDYSITAYPNDDSKGIVYVGQSEIGDAFAVLNGEERVKLCPACGDEKAYGKFCANQTEPDGRNRTCRECESTRRRKGRASEKAKREPQPQAA